MSASIRQALGERLMAAELELVCGAWWAGQGGRVADGPVLVEHGSCSRPPRSPAPSRPQQQRWRCDVLTAAQLKTCAQISRSRATLALALGRHGPRHAVGTLCWAGRVLASPLLSCSCVPDDAGRRICGRPPHTRTRMRRRRRSGITCQSASLRRLVHTPVRPCDHHSRCGRALKGTPASAVKNICERSESPTRPTLLHHSVYTTATPSTVDHQGHTVYNNLHSTRNSNRTQPQ